jgi:hypothetical protein
MPDSDPDHQLQWGDEEGEAPTPKAAPLVYDEKRDGPSTTGRLWNLFLILAALAGLALVPRLLIWGVLYYLLPGH